MKVTITTDKPAVATVRRRTDSHLIGEPVEVSGKSGESVEVEVKPSQRVQVREAEASPEAA